MKELEEIQENRMIDSWVRFFNRSPHQVNKTHESDAELVKIGPNDSYFLAVTVDSVIEEISEGLYRDPFTMGWVAVMSNFSDLAAVGAEPLGIVLSICFDPRKGEKFRQRMAAGIAAACEKIGVFVWGGDTNTARDVSLTGCAFGLVPVRQWMSRRGCRAGDIVFKGFQVECRWEKILDPRIFKVCTRVGIPYWFMAAGIHGEFELVFTIPEESLPSFLQEAIQTGFHPIQLGRVQDLPSLVVNLPSGKDVEIDMAPLRNLWASEKNGFKHCIQKYHFWGRKWGLE